MKPTYHLLGILAAAIIVAIAPAKLQAQEHPTEHPKKESALSPDAIAEEIEQYVQNKSEQNDGYFPFYDEETKTDLKLTLDKVHKDRLSKVADSLYFACSDFKSIDKKTYDLDFFLKEDSSGLEVTEMTIHKVNGEPRYSWVEEDGVWKRQTK